MAHVRIRVLTLALLGCLGCGCGGSSGGDVPKDTSETPGADLAGEATAVEDEREPDSSHIPETVDTEGAPDEIQGDFDPRDGGGEEARDGAWDGDGGAGDGDGGAGDDGLSDQTAVEVADAQLEDSSDTTVPGLECPIYLDGFAVATVTWPALTEASGLASSARNPGLFWVHNDSGDTARFFAMSVAGTVLGEFVLKGITAEDWEDIAVGPGPVAGESYLYVGDVGDNSLLRPTIQVVRLPEPLVEPWETPFSMELEGALSFDLVYPEGKSHNCETLAVDPLDATLVLVNKTGDTFSSVFTATLPELPLPLPTPLAFLTTIPIGISTGGDFSPDGTTLLVRNYFQAFIWQRYPTLEEPEMPTLAAMLSGPACAVPMVFEGLGESVTFARDVAGYYTLSEGVGQSLYLYERIPNGLGP